jgi:hypothetical protein
MDKWSWGKPSFCHASQPYCNRQKNLNAFYTVRNVFIEVDCLLGYVSLHSRRQSPSYLPLWESEVLHYFQWLSNYSISTQQFPFCFCVHECCYSVSNIMGCILASLGLIHSLPPNPWWPWYLLSLLYRVSVNSFPRNEAAGSRNWLLTSNWCLD